MMKLQNVTDVTAKNHWFSLAKSGQGLAELQLARQPLQSLHIPGQVKRSNIGWSNNITRLENLMKLCPPYSPWSILASYFILRKRTKFITFAPSAWYGLPCWWCLQTGETLKHKVYLVALIYFDAWFMDAFPCHVLQWLIAVLRNLHDSYSSDQLWTCPHLMSSFLPKKWQRRHDST